MITEFAGKDAMSVVILPRFVADPVCNGKINEPRDDLEIVSSLHGLTSGKSANVPFFITCDGSDTYQTFNGRLFCSSDQYSNNKK